MNITIYFTSFSFLIRRDIAHCFVFIDLKYSSWVDTRINCSTIIVKQLTIEVHINKYIFVECSYNTVSSRLTYTYKGDELLSLFFSPTKDEGLTMGFIDPAFNNVHFTIYKSPKDKRIHSHITDKSKATKPYSQQIDVELYGSLIRKLTKNWIVPAAEIKNVYIPNNRLWNKIKKISPQRIGNKTTIWPIEYFFSAVKTDLNNKKRWSKIAARDLPLFEDRMVLTIYKGNIRIVKLIPNECEHVLCCSELQYKRFMNRFLRLMGFDLFTSYIDSMKMESTKAAEKGEDSRGNSKETYPKTKPTDKNSDNLDAGRSYDTLPSLSGIATKINCEDVETLKIVEVSRIVGTVDDHHIWDSYWNLSPMDDSQLYEWHRTKLDRLLGNGGRKPFSQKDALSRWGSRNIELFELKGKYYVGNGQHRVAIAHIKGIKVIKALVRHCELMQKS